MHAIQHTATGAFLSSPVVQQLHSLHGPKVVKDPADYELSFDEKNDALIITSRVVAEEVVTLMLRASLKTEEPMPADALKIVEVSPMTRERLLAGLNNLYKSDRPKSVVQEQALRMVIEHLADCGDQELSFALDLFV